jgi:ABC-type Mn2+/Zn2+ transport system permease subunit
VVSVVLGLAAARAWGLAPGGTIVLVSALVFAVTSVFSGRPVPIHTDHH